MPDPIRKPLVWAALACLLPLVLSSYQVSLINYIYVASLIVLGFVVLTGAAGITSFGQASFAGIGAYLSAYVTTQFGVSPWLTLPASLLAGCLAAWIVGCVALRMSGHFLALATLAFALGLFHTLGNLAELGNFNGIGGIPPLTLFGLALDTDERMYHLILAALVIGCWTTGNLLDSRVGRAMRSLRHGRLISESMGADSVRLRMAAFVYSALLASLSGFLYAHMQRFVNPAPFAVDPSVEYLFMAVIGGLSSRWGAVAGAAIVILAQRWLEATLPDLLGQTGNFSIAVFGALMLFILQRARDGLWPRIAGLAGRRRWPPVASRPRPAHRDRPPPGTVVLEVRGAVKRFGGLVAVDGIGLTVQAGELLALLGPNGAGKSTMFNLVTGVMPVSDGEILFRGRRIDALRSRDIVALGIARTFQHVKIVPGMTVIENVAIGAYLAGSRGVVSAALRLNGAEEAMIRGDAAHQLERVGLSGLQHEPAANLALGQQRILEIARALAADPILLLLDEPAAGLRHGEKQVLASLLNQLKRDGMAILLVEHDMDFVNMVADRVVVMQHGRQLATGTPAAMRDDAEVRLAYLGADE